MTTATLDVATVACAGCGNPVTPDGTVGPLLTLYRETAKLNDQGFEA